MGHSGPAPGAGAWSAGLSPLSLKVRPSVWTSPPESIPFHHRCSSSLPSRPHPTQPRLSPLTPLCALTPATTPKHPLSHCPPPGAELLEEVLRTVNPCTPEAGRGLGTHSVPGTCRMGGWVYARDGPVCPASRERGASRGLERGALHGAPVLCVLCSCPSPTATGDSSSPAPEPWKPRSCACRETAKPKVRGPTGLHSFLGASRRSCPSGWKTAMIFSSGGI